MIPLPPAAPRRMLDIGQLLREALTLQQRGQLREAEKIYSRVIKAVPDQFDALHLLGTIKLQRGQAGEAYRLISSALKANPRMADAWVNLGVTLRILKRNQEALDSFDKALALAPGDAGALNERGNALLGLGRPAEALAVFERVAAMAPGHPEARLNLGIALATLARHQEAVAAFDAAMTASSNNPALHYNRGTSLSALGRHVEAVASFDRTLALAPGHAQALNNRGIALQSLKRYDEALASYARAIELQKGYPDAHFNRALTLLTIGDFRAGFAEYEWRWRTRGMSERRAPAQPLWLGEYPLQRRAILLQAEQGLGDTIQFARYVPLLAKTGAKIIVELQPALAPLLRGITGAQAVLASGEPLPPFDVYCPLGSLPLALKTEPATIPADIPYLKADEARLAKWRPRLEGLARPRVAVAWSGNPHHANDRNRSIPFAALAPLWDRGGFGFIGVQRELREDDARSLAGETRVLQVGSELDDFADTAAVLTLADAVVAVDTSVAHLAGALGRPVFIMVPFAPDWRWASEGEASRWYPTARLVRQPAPGDWASVVAAVRAALELLPR
jgi:tetratricopeptide (TPR) repeat protein